VLSSTSTKSTLFLDFFISQRVRFLKKSAKTTDQPVNPFRSELIRNSFFCSDFLPLVSVIRAVSLITVVDIKIWSIIIFWSSQISAWSTQRRSYIHMSTKDLLRLCCKVNGVHKLLFAT
jgi:hypothetical protein